MNFITRPWLHSRAISAAFQPTHNPRKSPPQTGFAHLKLPTLNPINTAPGDVWSAESNYTPLPEAFSDPSDSLPDNAFHGQPLALRHVRQLANAAAFATAQGCSLTAHVTIHFRLAEGFTPETWATFQTKLLDKASRWLKRRGLPVAFVWTREDGPRKGPHLHLLVHLPHAHWAAFHRFLIYAGRFQVSDAGGKAIVITGGSWGMMAQTMRSGALRYILKSLEASTSTLDALGIRQQPTRPVMLKRCGVSTTIAQKARQEAGWVDMRTFPELHAHLHPAANDNAVEASHAA